MDRHTHSVVERPIEEVLPDFGERESHGVVVAISLSSGEVLDNGTE